MDFVYRPPSGKEKFQPSDEEMLVVRSRGPDGALIIPPPITQIALTLRMLLTPARACMTISNLMLDAALVPVHCESKSMTEIP
jgi:hypothetical protein